MRVARCCSRGGRRWHCSALARRTTAADWRGSMKNGAARASAEGIARPALALNLVCSLEWQGRLRLAGSSSKQVAKQQHWHEANSGTASQQSSISDKQAMKQQSKMAATAKQSELQKQQQQLGSACLTCWRRRKMRRRNEQKEDKV
jgi:hypothetical protein